MTASTMGDIRSSDNFNSRPWHSADSAKLTEFDDCARVNLEWKDGAWLYFLCDTKAEAIHHLRRYGFAPKG